MMEDGCHEAALLPRGRESSGCRMRSERSGMTNYVSLPRRRESSGCPTRSEHWGTTSEGGKILPTRSGAPEAIGKVSLLLL